MKSTGNSKKKSGCFENKKAIDSLHDKVAVNEWQNLGQNQNGNDSQNEKSQLRLELRSIVVVVNLIRFQST